MSKKSTTSKPIQIIFGLSEYDWITSAAKNRGLARSTFIRQEMLRLKSQTERLDAQSS